MNRIFGGGLRITAVEAQRQQQHHQGGNNNNHNSDNNNSRQAYDPNDYYGHLGVPNTAPASAIKAAYRKLALKYHVSILCIA